MDTREIFAVLAEYSEATRLPVSCFCHSELIYRSMDFLTDFNLPILLLQCLPENLPPAWYSLSPEYMYMGGLRNSESGLLIFIGPALVNECSPGHAARILDKIGRKARDVAELTHYFNFLGDCSAGSLLAGIRLLQRIIFQSAASPTEVDFHWNQMPRFSSYSPAEPDEDDVSDLEKELVKCISNGKIEYLEEIIQKEILVDNKYKLPPRQKRIYINSANFFCSRTAIGAGVDSVLITALHTSYQQRIQQASASELTYIFVEFIREYTRQVAMISRSRFGSPLAERVNQYVSAHLYEKITPTLLAGHFHISLSYLCRQFKADTGKTVSFFIQERKIEEARHLLLQNILTITAISQLLGFSSTSYFGSLFKKHTKMTPAEYCRHSGR